MTTDKKQLLAMRMQTRTDRSLSGTPCVEFTFDFLVLEHSPNDTDFCRHGTNGWSHDFNDYYSHLRASERADVGGVANAGDIYYVDLYRVKLYQAERMVKTMKMIERKMAKAQEKHGYPADLADYAARLAAAIGVEVLLLRRGAPGYRWNSHDMNGHAVNQMRLAITNALTPIETPSEELATA